MSLFIKLLGFFAVDIRTHMPPDVLLFQHGFKDSLIR